MKKILCSGFVFGFLLFSWNFSISQTQFPQNRQNARAIGLGNAYLTSVQTPFAALSNPAALALIQDMQLTASTIEMQRLNFAGLANFFPDIGTFAVGFSRLRLVQGSPAVQKPLLNRWTFAYGRSFSNTFLAGAGVHWNRITGMDNSMTFSASLLAFPATRYEFRRLFASHESTFNHIILPQKFAVAFALQDVSVGRKILDPYIDVGAYYRVLKSGPTVFGAVRFSENDEIVRFGAAAPLKHYIDMFVGLEQLDIKKAAIGASIRFPKQSIDFSYSFAEKAFFLDFSTRIGKSPIERAKGYRQQGIYYARQKQYDRALNNVKKYLSYLPTDSQSVVLQNWLLEQVAEKENRIHKLIDIAQGLEKKQWYIGAALTYKQILELDGDNEHARWRMSEIKSGLQSNLKRLYDLALSEFRDGNFKASERAFATILQLQPDHERSEQYLQKISAFYAQNAEELYYRGLGFFNQKRYDKAASAFEEALRFEPENPEAQKYFTLSKQRLTQVKKQTEQLFQAAQRLERQNQILNAFQTYKKIIAINPDNDEANFAIRQLTPKMHNSLLRMESRGKSYFENGEFERARTLFQTLLSYDATSKAANFYLTRIEEEDKKRIDALFEHGMAEFDTRNWDQAIALFDSLLAIQSNYDMAQEKRREALAKSSFEELLKTADAYYQSGKYMKAIDYYEQVQNRVPDNENIRRRIIECRERLSAFVDLHFSKAINLYAAEDYSGAIRELQTVLEADPSHAGSQEYLKKAQKRLIAIETLQ